MPHRLTDLLIDAIDQIPGRTSQRAVKGPEESLGWRGERLQDARGAAVARHACADRIEKSDRGVDRLGGEFLIARAGLQREAAVIDREQDRVGPRLVQRRIRMHRIL